MARSGPDPSDDTPPTPQPAVFAPPADGDTGPVPRLVRAPGPPGSGAPAGPAARPPHGPPPPAWPGNPTEPETTVLAAQPHSYADRIRPAELVPVRKNVPAHGWRRLLYKLTFGAVNVGPSPAERRIAALEAAVRAPLRGNFKVGVLGKGGVGKTTVSACIGSVFAELRQDDRVIAVDADTAFGKLGSRIDPRVQGSFWELATDRHLDTFADVRNRVGSNTAGLFVLAGEATPARRRVLDPALYREAVARLDRYFTIAVVDCSSTMDAPVTQEALRDLDALVVVSSPWVDGAAAAGQTLDWLAAHGLNSLLQRTVVVLNDSDGHATKRTRTILAQQFSGHGQLVIEVPFDGDLRPGGVIDGTAAMSAAAREKFVEICAALASHFPLR
ncbi:MinD/ParA family protein [Mycolicibacterium sp. 018/SC-01/001]|nr:MinD/ParA family protein [Mycolicibacterium sp. 018/SC-01/001]